MIEQREPPAFTQTQLFLNNNFMSSFMVSNDTINHIATAGITSDAFQGYASAEEFGQALRQLNEEALRARYEDGETMYANYPYWYEHKWTKTGQVLKNVECLQYQCLEGEVPQSPLFKSLVRYRYELTRQLLETIPEYRNADWE